MTRPIAFRRPDQREVELLPWSGPTLDDLAKVTEEDVRKARVFWRNLLPARYRSMLDAIAKR